MDARHGHHDPGESPVHGPAGVEPAADRYRASRSRQRDPWAQVRAAVEPARRMGISRRPAHPALVSEDDFVAAQDINASRGPVPHDEPVLRRYQLAGLLACGLCGRRMESAWSNGKAAYRCRRGRTSAMAPDPSRPKNTYIREDKLLPHLPALHLFLTTPAKRARRRTRAGADVSGTVSPAEVIGYLREHEITLTWNPSAAALQARVLETAKIVTVKAS
jgi:site-specific DNA recombinase